jgi:hypothetical protein
MQGSERAQFGLTRFAIASIRVEHQAFRAMPRGETLSLTSEAGRQGHNVWPATIRYVRREPNRRGDG